MTEKIWKILNKVLRCNFYHDDMRPKYIPFKLWNLLRELYRKQVEIPYYNSNADKIKQDLLYNSKTAKYAKFIKGNIKN